MKNYSLLIVICLLIGCNNQERTFKTKEALIEELIMAINTNDSQRYLKTIHPIERDLFSDQNSEYFQDKEERVLRHDIPETVKITYDTKYLEILKSFKNHITFPKSPMSGVHIEFNKTEYSSVSIVRYLTNDELGWHLVQGIPSSSTIKKFKESLIKSKELKKKVKLHIENLGRGTHDRVVEILTNEKSVIRAYKLHMKETGSDLTFSVNVVKQIQINEGLTW